MPTSDMSSYDRPQDRINPKDMLYNVYGEPYGGPVEYMEAGARGFLICTLDRKEEFGTDDAMDLLRQTAIKLYGGYKPRKNSKGMERDGYVKVNCLDLEKIQIFPNPEGEAEEKEEKKDGEAAGDVEMKEETKEKDKDAKADEDEKKEDESGETDNKEEKMDDENKDGGDGKEKTEEETKKEENKNREEKRREKEHRREEARKEEDRRRDANIPRMHSVHKFQAYRTELKNVLFVKSDVPDPMEMAQGALELALERGSVTGDAVHQLLPVIGICDYDYNQLEIMVRRTIGPMFSESLEPQTFGVILVDKLSEPGSEMIYETVRSTVWAHNPLASLSSPLTEPDVVLRFELVGSKIVLSALRHFMRLRQYNPTTLVEQGPGAGEDDDGGWVSEETKRQNEQRKLEKEKRKEEERKKQEERMEEKKKRMQEGEARRKAREEERKKKEEQRKKEKEEGKKTPSKDGEKKSSSNSESKNDEGSVPAEGAENEDGETPPSKRQRTDDEQTPEEEGEKEVSAEAEMDTSVQEETPPSKKKRVDSESQEATNDDEDEDTKDEEDDTPKKSQKKTTRGKRAGRRKAK